MQPTRVGIREFRENLSSYLESKTPVAITRHSATIGIYLPAKPKPSKADIAAFRVAGEKMQEVIAAAGTSAAPVSPFREAAEELPIMLRRRAMPVAPGLTTLGAIGELVRTLEFETYAPMEALARQRLARRDEDDWPILAAALALRCPIWTEDTDFFGCGVATWTTDRVELYLANAMS